jgi:hypothetical protein
MGKIRLFHHSPFSYAYPDIVSRTLISHAGHVSHIGQFFFDEASNDATFALSPYTSNTNSRTYNDEDSILAQENADGNNAFIECVFPLLGTVDSVID